MKFKDKLNMLIRSKKSFLCVGLDSDIDKLPVGIPGNAKGIVEFNKHIIQATSDVAIAYKLNIAFYERLGVAGWEALGKTLQMIPEDTLRIADAKRGDIGNTSRQYARTFFETYHFDAITVAPYMGSDSLSPFFEYEEKGIFVLCLTSNPGSRDFQYLKSDGLELYKHLAFKIKEWNRFQNIGIVAGATHPEELKGLREILPDVPFLIPGVGVQGGDLEKVLQYGLTRQKDGVLINSSRGIIFASDGEDFAEKARNQALKLVTAFREKMIFE
jgi:orotidine-5'-phosphate decarboxylase